MFLCTVSTLIGTTDTKTTSSHVTLRTGLIRSGSLKNLTNVNIGHAATEILRTLEAGIGTTNVEMAHDRFDVPGTSTGGDLIETLKSNRTTKVVDSSGNNRSASSGKAGSIHQISMLNIQRKLIGRRFSNIDTGDIAETLVNIRNKSRSIFCNRSGTFILNEKLERTVSLNRTTFTNNRQLHIRATLRGREGRSEIIFQPATGKKIAKDRFLESSITDTINKIPTILIGSDRQLIINVLIAVVLIPNQTITTEGKSGNRSSGRNTIGYTSLDDIRTCIGLNRKAESGNKTILGLVSPIAFSIRL